MKKKIILFLLVCGVFLLVGAVERLLFTDDPQQMERAARSVFRLEVYNERNEKISTGTGFCLFEEDLLVTCSHVFVNGAYMIAHDDDGNSFQIENYLTGDSDVDIAFFRLPEEIKYTPLTVSERMILRGDKVAAIGSQAGITNLVTTGVLSGRWKTEGGSFLLFTAPIAPGTSGGALLNNKGEVEGIICGTFDQVQNMNLAIPVEEAERIYIHFQNLQ